MLAKLKSMGRKQLGYLLTSALIIVAGLLLTSDKLGSITIALVSTYTVFATGHTITDMMGSKPPWKANHLATDPAQAEDEGS